MKTFYKSENYTLLEGDATAVLQKLPDASIQTVVTSPPYWNLRDYKIEGQIGLEPSLSTFLERLVLLFREVRRVLRPDGTIWVNMGDSYATGTTAKRKLSGAEHGGWSSEEYGIRTKVDGLEPKNLIGQPWRLAFALQDDGWILRSDVIWHKPNPMPESATDRPSKAHEYLFLLSKEPRYFYDQEAVREPLTAEVLRQYESAVRRYGQQKGSVFAADRFNDAQITAQDRGDKLDRTVHGIDNSILVNPAGRNKRTVWTIPTEPSPEAHFATFPVDLVKPCILASTSQKGNCSVCGSPWKRLTQPNEGYAQLLGKGYHDHTDDLARGQRGAKAIPEDASRITVGWESTCEHADAPVVPAVVLDPFAGTGTTPFVAKALGRRGLGIELNPAYLDMAMRRDMGGVSRLAKRRR